MADPTPPTLLPDPVSGLQPPPYQLEIVEHLKMHESELWQWFEGSRPTGERSDSVRLDLLKSTYRIEPEEAAELYELTRDVVTALGLDCAVTLYRAQSPQGLNVSIAYIPGEAHIVLHGAIQDALTRPELRAVLAHELCHYLLYQGWGGELGRAEEILLAMASDDAAEECHVESLRLFRLYTEILADRGAYHVTADPLIAVSGLLKLETGEREVSAESYLRQALEIFGKEAARARGISHPETFVRTYALHLWAQSREEADPQVRQILEGPLRLDGLDLLGQRRVLALTRRLIEALLAPSWIQTDPLLGHARLFFEDFSPPAEEVTDDELAQDLATDDEQLRNYYCYVLLDFVAIDRELEEAPLAAALALTERLGLTEPLLELVRKELKLSKTLVEKVRKGREKILARARAEHER